MSEAFRPRSNRLRAQPCHPQHRHRLARTPREVFTERCFERGVRELVDAQRAQQRVPADPRQQRRSPDDDAGLRATEQLVTAEADDVRARCDALLHASVPAPAV